MTSSRPPRPIRCFIAAFAALLAACATPVPDRPTGAGTPGVATGMQRAAQPAADPWPAERDRLGAELTGTDGVAVGVRDDGALQILIAGADAFAKDKTSPSPGLRATLDRIARVLVPDAGTEIQVLGHTDSIGSELYNLQLSIRRAETVVEYLRTRGVALGRLHADGRGEAEPVADNGTESGRAKNRRVEIVVRPFR